MSKDKQETVVGGVQYRENVVLGIVDTPDAAQAASQALTSGGFLESEVALGCGLEWADRVRASSGRSGLIGQVLQVLDRYGAGGDEMDMKGQYEQALRAGKCTVAVFAPTDERKRLATDILRQHGGHFINFLGHLSIERMA